MIRLIASDMDGTLLDENGRLPPETFALIHELRQNGVIFAASSGRRYQTLRRFFAPWRTRWTTLPRWGPRSTPMASWWATRCSRRFL